MSDATMFIWLIAFGATALGGIPYLIWMIVTAVKKRWRKLAILAGVPIVAYGILAVATGFIDRAAYHGSAESFDRIMSLKVRPREIVSIRQGSIDFTGLFVYEFPTSSQQFLNDPPKTFYQCPRPLSYEADHTFVRWRITPVADEHSHFTRQALRIGKGMGLSEDHCDRLESVHRSQAGYYAVAYEDDGDGRSHNITLYVLDPGSRHLYHFTDTNRVFKQNKAVERSGASG